MMIWLIVSILIWGLIHSLLASLKAKQLAQLWFGAQFMRFYRLHYNVFSVLSFLPVLAIAALTQSRTLYEVPFPWSGLMFFGELLAVAALGIGLLQTGIWEFLGLQFLGADTRSSQLQISGLYRYVRHPLYAAGLLFIWLYPRMTDTILVTNLALTIYILIGAFFEERKLRREFGQEYLDYAAATPMLIPFTKRKKT
jgi:methanethiol S-methyltransferase